ncbi:methylthioadenosine phosphorylase [Ectothiorhodosinus mongolicus]|uniref:Probable S-methyl-5'-thioinosine phosphorylase n=1 Tax=Ectothiorhodosinus mongolicus TaxID=233100 RepID=A0A1R3VM84_9GAMM|nr:S-methyl-5'-thioinosine phosphorylase [Ectothiorhodosinus mongolicus]ULX57802.1 S-methyl-5'-thioadenosine phosphorylase [Ectothiorhodosinus mongolicus]SIT65667.1 methylthioadenosine phosphorylase [Ectothiorhodosinus mongolicus]
MNQPARIAIIGGTGLTSIEGLKIVRREVMHTPFGEPSGPLTHGELSGHEVVFLPRHGSAHTIPPHRINYRANLWALRHLGVQSILAVAAVGGITAEMRPRRLVIPDQIIDYTYGRDHTFFEEDLDFVTHIDFTEPYSAHLREHMLKAAAGLNIDVATQGTYAATQGPRLETRAEINRLEGDGGDIVGMTGMPEAALARELGVDYACCAVVANWAAGRDDPGHQITMDEVRDNVSQAMNDVRRLLAAVISRV